MRRLPQVAALGFGIILVATLVLGLAMRRNLQRLERELYPALEFTRALDDQLGQAQAALQDAAAVGDRDRLAAADAIAVRMDTTLARWAAIGGETGGAAPVVARAVRRYYASARAVAVRLVEGSVGEAPANGALVGDAAGASTPEWAIERMMVDHRALRTLLGVQMARERADIDDAFHVTRLVQTAMWGGIAFVSLIALAVLAVLALRLSRGIVQPLQGAVRAAERLAEGDLTVTIPDAPADEVGQLVGALRRTVAYLHQMSAVADAIAAGDVSASPAPRSERDRFGIAFAAMTTYLQETAGVADRLAHGDLALAIAPRSDRDAFGRSLGITLERLTGTIHELRRSEVRLRTAEEGARAREARWRALVQESSDVIVVLDPERRVLYASPAIERVLGLSAVDFEGTDALARVHPEDTTAAVAAMEQVLAARGEQARVQLRMARADGGWRDLECAITNLLHEPAVQGIVVNARDVTERSALQAQLTHQAFHDPLTGLANRALFRDRVAQALRGAARDPDRSVAVLFLDLDNFKTVNDSLGHHAGDRLLQTVATRLLSATRGCDTVARLGGDEFAVLVEHVREASDTLVVVERVTSALARPVTVDGHEVFAAGSVGVAIADPGDTADVLLRNADVAMYGAKAAGKGRTQLFEPSLLAATLDRIELESDLARALDRGEFHVLYQPIVELRTRGIAGAEALVRWTHPERGVVSPVRFIPIAESTGHIVALGRWVLRTACHEAAAWPLRDDGRGRTVTVNVSGRQLADPALVDDVRAALAESGLDPVRLTLEITESVLMQDTERHMAALHALKALGVRLAIDDFGTGYSSLSYLQRFPVDVLKIDKSFIDGIPGRGHDAALASIIVALGEMLNLRTVAEGIEREEQQVHLEALGCEFGQGYLFDRPLAGETLRARLAADGPDAATDGPWRTARMQ